MSNIISFLTEVYNYLLNQDLIFIYLIFIFFIILTVWIDEKRKKKKIIINGWKYQLISILTLSFFLYLYIDLFQAVNMNVLKYRAGDYDKTIGIYESTSNYFKHNIGDSYITGVIALLGTVFAFFLKLQLNLIKIGYFCQNKNNGSLFINMIIILLFFAILAFIDHLQFTEFKVSEGMVMRIDNPSYFFSILLLTTIVVFFIMSYWHKESILSQLIKEKEIK